MRGTTNKPIAYKNAGIIKEAEKKVGDFGLMVVGKRREEGGGAEEGTLTVSPDTSTEGGRA